MMYDAVIGLEVHAELNTKTKMYCACENRFGGDTNSRICPICAGMPGAMPALNREAVVMAISAGLMMGCEINRVTRMCRKHYFYPDLPKGYQISQYKDPLCVNGSFDYFSDNTVKTAYIRQIHIEEDAGKLTHGDVTAVDLNRCGVPLIEIVTQPCFNSAIDAYSFLTSVRTMLLYLGISDCAMQEGSLRCDVNVSLRPHGVPELSPRVEMKNVSTFTGARRAIEFEIARQRVVLESGGVIFSETRRWDDEARCSYLMRDKESANDYRFMPEPDIPPIAIDEKTINSCSERLPEGEISRCLRYIKELQIGEYEAHEIAKQPDLSRFLDKCSMEAAKSCASYLLGDVSHIINSSGMALKDSRLTPSELCKIVRALKNNEINGAAAKIILSEIFINGGSFKDIACRLKLIQMTDDTELSRIVKSVFESNPKAISDYKSGKSAALSYLVGQCMRAACGRGNHRRFIEMIKNAICEEN